MRLAVAVAAGLLATRAMAETAYVDDRLQVGVHKAPNVASPIGELIASGTTLEVLERDGEMARVRTPGGAEGWVDAAFLSAEPPGRTQVQRLETELAGAQAALADAQAKIVALEQRPGPSNEPAGATEQTIPSDALREMQRLAEEHQRLKQQLAEMEAVQRMAREQAEAAREAQPAPAAPPPVAKADVTPSVDLPLPLPAGWRWESWQLLLVASVLLLAFSAGGWLVDWGVRRRHGGFRV